jgi:hypothetical protein
MRQVCCGSQEEAKQSSALKENSYSQDIPDNSTQHLSDEVLRHIVGYALSSKEDVPPIALTCKSLHEFVNVNPSTSPVIWRNIATLQHPKLLPVLRLCEEPEGFKEWYKEILDRAASSTFEPRDINLKLQKNLELAFKDDDGIYPFLGLRSFGLNNRLCCRWRPHGICEFRLCLIPVRDSYGNIHLYRHNVEEVSVNYSDCDYVVANWAEECAIIKRWCIVLGVKEYTVKKPESVNEFIVVRFKEPLSLERP